MSISTGLCTLIGLILYIGAITEEAGNKPKSTMDEPKFQYWYGVSFVLTVASFTSAELTGVLSVYLYISRHKHAYRKKVDRLTAVQQRVDLQQAAAAAAGGGGGGAAAANRNNGNGGGAVVYHHYPGGVGGGGGGGGAQNESPPLQHQYGQQHHHTVNQQNSLGGAGGYHQPRSNGRVVSGGGGGGSSNHLDNFYAFSPLVGVDGDVPGAVLGSGGGGGGGAYSGYAEMAAQPPMDGGGGGGCCAGAAMMVRQPSRLTLHSSSACMMVCAGDTLSLQNDRNMAAERRTTPV